MPRKDSSSVAALDPVKLDACATKADALLKRMDSLDGKFQHHKGKDNVRPDASYKTISVLDLNQSYSMLFESINCWLDVWNVQIDKEKNTVTVKCSQGSWNYPMTARVKVVKK